MMIDLRKIVHKYIWVSWKAAAFRTSVKPARIDAYSLKNITRANQAGDNINLEQDDMMDLDMEDSKHIHGTSPSWNEVSGRDYFKEDKEQSKGFKARQKFYSPGLPLLGSDTKVNLTSLCLVSSDL